MSCKCFTPNSILQIDRKKTFVYNVNFRNIQLIHHAKDSDCCFFMIPSFPKTVSVWDWNWQYKFFRLQRLISNSLA